MRTRKNQCAHCTQLPRQGAPWLAVRLLQWSLSSGDGEHSQASFWRRIMV